MSKKTVHFNQKYDWDKWTKPRKSPLVLTQGKDFMCLPHGFASQFRNYVRRKGIKGKFQYRIGADTVTITRTK